MTLFLQVQGHRLDAVERGSQELLVDYLHHYQVHLGLALRRVVE
tara:strand:- start:1866 stop:1997 length:132 start_codon:yes stop_codon:yes gene_type:complete